MAVQLHPEHRDKPLGVSQKTILASSNQLARSRGVRKMDTIAHARAVCPDIVIVVGEDLTPFRRASLQIFQLLHTLLPGVPVQRLGFDEFFLDVTQLATQLASEGNAAACSVGKPPLSEFDPGILHGHVVDSSWQPSDTPVPASEAEFWVEGEDGRGMLMTAAAESELNSCQADKDEFDGGDVEPLIVDDDEDVATRGQPPFSSCTQSPTSPTPSAAQLRAGSAIAAWLRANIFTQLAYTCRAGTGANKTLAKMVGEVHKPNAQTTLLPEAHSAFILSKELRKVGGMRLDVAAVSCVLKLPFLQNADSRHWASHDVQA